MESWMAIQIVDNFLDKNEFNNINSIITGDNFPWYYNNFITNKKDTNDKLYFTHTFYREPAIKSNWFNLWETFLIKIKCKSIMRIKGNLYLNNNIKKINKPHKDYDFKHKGCIYYINSNNGATYFGKKKVIPKANRAVFFDPSEEHSSSLCTDQKRRITINFNYF